MFAVFKKLEKARSLVQHDESYPFRDRIEADTACLGRNLPVATHLHGPGNQQPDWQWDRIEWAIPITENKT